MKKRFEFPCRIYWEDTDAGGVVYYANYLKFMERCRTEWLRALGIDQYRLRRERQLQFVVVRVVVDFLRPAVLNDEVLVTAELERLGGATTFFDLPERFPQPRIDLVVLLGTSKQVLEQFANEVFEIKQ